MNLEVIEKFQANNYRLLHWKKTVPFAHGNFLEIRTGIFGRMVSAPGIQTSVTVVILFVLSWWIINEFEKMYQTLKNMFDLFSKHSEVRKKYPAASRFPTLFSLFENEVCGHIPLPSNRVRYIK